ncbi:MAG: universal stress protein [Cyanobacteria bacterium P01_C01_bin.118]
MIRKIVVGVDSSALSRKALRSAIAFAQSCGAELKLVHVLVDNEPGAPRFSGYFGSSVYPTLSTAVIESYQTEWNQFVDRSQALLDQQVADVQEQGINASGVLLYGSPGARLCEIAQTADLVIVGSRGLSGISELLIGSVSNYVLHHAPCSVMVIHADPNPADPSPQTAPPLKRILVPLDKSETAQQAMAMAISLAKLHQAEIRLLHVIDDDDPGLPQKLFFSDSQYISPHSELLFAEYRQEWNKFINTWWQTLQLDVDAIEAEGVEAICDVMQGRISQRICEVAQDWPADIIVMGCRGFSGLKELLVGSISYYVSHRARCSVFITRPTPAKETHSKQETRQVVLAKS